MHTELGHRFALTHSRTLRRWLDAWLALGIAACLLLPSARAFNPWIGWLPYWLVVAPALMRLTLILAGTQNLMRLLRRNGTRRSSRRRAPAVRLNRVARAA